MDNIAKHSYPRQRTVIEMETHKHKANQCQVIHSKLGQGPNKTMLNTTKQCESNQTGTSQFHKYPLESSCCLCFDAPLTLVSASSE